MNDTLELLKSHRSIRAFKNTPIDHSQLLQIIEAGQAAATSSFIQACTVINVTDPSLREELMECSGGQAYVKSAPTFLVFCADMKRHQLACELHNADMQSGFTEQFITATVDCGLFAQNVAVAAESLGLGIVYIGGLRNQIQRASDALNLPELVYPVFGMCIGYPDQDPEVKPRLPLGVVFKENRYDDAQDSQKLADYDKQIEAYYQSRSGNNKVSGWTNQISGMLVKEARPHMLRYLQDRGFIKR
jgi:nitroreductase